MDIREEGAVLCAPFLMNLPVDGLSISVVTDSGTQSTVGVTDVIASRLEKLQFQLGEGPTPDVLRSGNQLLMPDLDSAAARTRWPVFIAEALETGARGLFSFPLLVGPMTVGVVSLHVLLLVPPWSEEDLRTAVALAAEATRPAMRWATRSAAAEIGPATPGRLELHREVHQASGMLTVQLDCSIDEAMSRLRAHAFAEGQELDTVARHVVARTLNFADFDD